MKVVAYVGQHVFLLSSGIVSLLIRLVGRIESYVKASYLSICGDQV